jgi:hypothetical protein
MVNDTSKGPVKAHRLLVDRSGFSLVKYLEEIITALQNERRDLSKKQSDIKDNLDLTKAAINSKLNTWFNVMGTKFGSTKQVETAKTLCVSYWHLEREKNRRQVAIDIFTELIESVNILNGELLDRLVTILETVRRIVGETARRVDASYNRTTNLETYGWQNINDIYIKPDDVFSDIISQKTQSDIVKDFFRECNNFAMNTDYEDTETLVNMISGFVSNTFSGLGNIVLEKYIEKLFPGKKPEDILKEIIPSSRHLLLDMAHINENDLYRLNVISLSESQNPSYSAAAKKLDIKTSDNNDPYSINLMDMVVGFPLFALPLLSQLKKHYESMEKKALNHVDKSFVNLIKIQQVETYSDITEAGFFWHIVNREGFIVKDMEGWKLVMGSINEELAKDRKSSRGVFINNTELLKMVKNCLYSKDNPNFPINEGEEPNPEMVISYLNDKVSKVQEELKKAIKENDIENQEVLNDELRHYRRYVEDMER